MSRSETILLESNDDSRTSYSDILRVVRNNVKPRKCGVEVRSIRSTKAGRVFLELEKPTEESRAKFTEASKTTVGKQGAIRPLVPKTTLEIRDLDVCTTEDEHKEALKRALLG